MQTAGDCKTVLLSVHCSNCIFVNKANLQKAPQDSSDLISNGSQNVISAAPGTSHCLKDVGSMANSATVLKTDAMVEPQRGLAQVESHSFGKKWAHMWKHFYDDTTGDFFEEKEGCQFGCDQDLTLEQAEDSKEVLESRELWDKEARSMKAKSRVGGEGGQG